jgi:hypothetical protein
MRKAAELLLYIVAALVPLPNRGAVPAKLTRLYGRDEEGARTRRLDLRSDRGHRDVPCLASHQRSVRKAPTLIPIFGRVLQMQKLKNYFGNP